MRVLIVDDSLDKISELSKVIYEIDPNAHIETCENISNAILCLTEGDFFNLAVIDLFLPLRNNDKPKEDGGQKLLSEIYRKKGTLKVPNYIVGFSQYEDNTSKFSTIWNVIKYCSNNSSQWKNSFRTLLNHINSTELIKINIENIKPTIFVEGLTDLYYLKQTIEIFFNELSDKVNIVSQKNAGANWVANQIPIWAMRLQKDQEDKYVKAVGLLDSDEAGNKAKRKVDQRNLTENEKECCSYFQLKPNYNKQVVEFYKKGCQIEIEIESLFPTYILDYAESKGWLEHRTPTFIEPPTDWKQHENNSIEYISKKNISNDALIFLKKVKAKNKEDFKKYIESVSSDENTFLNFKPLIEDLFKKIKILK